jgi:AraC-like DNA-binding protein
LALQNQRLNRAFLKMMKPPAVRARVIDFAFDFGFSSDSSFIRAFRHKFGLTPGEAKHLSAFRTIEMTAGRDGVAWPAGFTNHEQQP